ncbi:unnamed protein product [Symbiodinium sp. CCMP2456]|nr:unnamed protein product [Symbiodinium sp. CCMP2456]
MLVRARAYYRTGLFELADADRVAYILADLDSISKMCPAVALQALLLKLEDNIVVQPGAFEALMSRYTSILHQAIRDQTITPQDMNNWPLDYGAERVLNISRALAIPRRLTAAVVMNYCQVVDRWGTSQLLTWLVEPPFGEPIEGVESGLLKNAELFIYQVDWPWCQPLAEEVLDRLRVCVKELHVVTYRGGPRREEQTAYFKFILDHWDSLPDFTIFVHPDADEHQGQRFLALTRALKLINTQSQFASDALGYYPLAQQMVVDPRRTWGHRGTDTFASTWRRFWRRVFGHAWEDLGFEEPRCMWEKHVGKFLPKHADGISRRHSVPDAKLVCRRLGNACRGVTCGTSVDASELEGPGREKFGQASCTVREGSEGLSASPEAGEFSYVKTCRGKPSDDGQREAVAKSTYQAAKRSFLLGFAAEDSVARGEAEARRRCDELGDLCTGFTCEKSIQVTPEMTKKDYQEAQNAQSCTVRAGSSSSELFESPTEELTFVKVSPSPKLQEAVLRETTKPDANLLFQFYTGSQSVVRKDLKGGGSAFDVCEARSQAKPRARKDRLRWWPRAEIEAFAADGVWCSDTTGLVEATSTLGPLFLKWGIPTFFSYGDEGDEEKWEGSREVPDF